MGNDASTLAFNKKGISAIKTVKDMPPSSDTPVVASFDSEHLTVGAGVAIFHVASSRVVVCYHSTHGYWFLPKGRRDTNEETGAAAEREGFEEVSSPIELSVSQQAVLIPLEWISEPPSTHRPASPPAASLPPSSPLLYLIQPRTRLDAASSYVKHFSIRSFLVHRRDHSSKR